MKLARCAIAARGTSPKTEKRFRIGSTLIRSNLRRLAKLFAYPTHFRLLNSGKHWWHFDAQRTKKPFADQTFHLDYEPLTGDGCAFLGVSDFASSDHFLKRHISASSRARPWRKKNGSKFTNGWRRWGRFRKPRSHRKFIWVHLRDLA
jgi:hypothetical protein